MIRFLSLLISGSPSHPPGSSHRLFPPPVLCWICFLTRCLNPDCGRNMSGPRAIHHRAGPGSEARAGRQTVLSAVLDLLLGYSSPQRPLEGDSWSSRDNSSPPSMIMQLAGGCVLPPRPPTVAYGSVFVSLVRLRPAGQQRDAVVRYVGHCPAQPIPLSRVLVCCRATCY
ncbi:hypothetical protein PBY51_004616 [Eleginops maclovinus]|uniref:Uncharacterized protein n=1 Tax=Eleginops maclovinus TaxID=56733 RepID=A0AAN7Y345_ELEMC|nr:hypothetical protein PBY51_004616 [Eleginops maclovinus]